MSSKISIVIPVGIGDTSWINLLKNLSQVMPKKPSCEVILSVSSGDDQFDSENCLVSKSELGFSILIVRGGCGRAKQLNRGIDQASFDNIWALHADSLVTADHLLAVGFNLKHGEDCLYFFSLGFSAPKNSLLFLNQFGANVRSRFLGMPFGDQGFFFKKSLWQRLGGFPENARYGEDHLFVWRCHQSRVPLCGLKTVLYTSARRYDEDGWLQTTVKFAYLTWTQALPEALKCVAYRIAKRKV